MWCSKLITNHNRRCRGIVPWLKLAQLHRSSREYSGSRDLEILPTYGSCYNEHILYSFITRKPDFFLLLICPEILGKHRKSVSIQYGRGNLGCWRFWGTKNTNKCVLKYHSNQLFFYPERHNAFTKRWECTTLWSVMLDLTEEKQSIANRDKMHQCYWEHS